MKAPNFIYPKTGLRKGASGLGFRISNSIRERETSELNQSRRATLIIFDKFKQSVYGNLWKQYIGDAKPDKVNEQKSVYRLSKICSSITKFEIVMPKKKTIIN